MTDQNNLDEWAAFIGLIRWTGVPGDEPSADWIEDWKEDKGGQHLNYVTVSKELGWNLPPELAHEWIDTQPEGTIFHIVAVTEGRHLGYATLGEITLNKKTQG